MTDYNPHQRRFYTIVLRLLTLIVFKVYAGDRMGKFCKHTMTEANSLHTEIAGDIFSLDIKPND